MANKRNNIFSLRLTDEEYKNICERAEKEGLSKAAYMRMVLFREASK